MGIDQVHEHIRRQQTAYLDILKQLVAQPSISAWSQGVRECAGLLAAIMRESGLEADILETGGQPIVMGHVPASVSGAPTVLFYGHYDVELPGSDVDWTSRPFEPTVSDGRLFGRGASDNKGQLLTHVLAVRSYLSTRQRVPINVKFLFEGEEEISSRNLASFVRDNRDLVACDLVYTSDGPLHESGRPTMVYGCRGILKAELTLRTSYGDNHSGHAGGVIPNAALELARAISSLVDAKGRVLIEGFYDGVLEPSEEELRLINQAPFDAQTAAAAFGVQDLPMDGASYYRRVTLEPTISVNGFVSGHTGRGPKTIVPAVATVKLDVRIVVNQDPLDILEKLTWHLQQQNPSIRVEQQGYLYPSRTAVDVGVSRPIRDALEQAYGQPPVRLPALGGGLPDHIWTKIVGVPSIGVPYSNADCHNHAPDENISLDCFYKGIHASAQVMHELGEMT